jgi:Uma2 family endonuclease
MTAPAIRRATYADLEAVPPHLVAEIVRGVLVTHPRPAPRHATAAFSIADELGGPFQKGRGGPGGWLFMSEPELHLADNVIVPDLCAWRRERLPSLPATAFVNVAPDWVCEILSPSTVKIDRGAKRQVYADAGVGHLWLLDPDQRQLEVFALTAGHWLLLATIESGQDVSCAPFDAISFPLNDLFPFDAPPSTEA